MLLKYLETNKEGLFMFQLEGLKLITKVRSNHANINTFEILYKFRKGNRKISIVTASLWNQFLLTIYWSLVPKFGVCLAGIACIFRITPWITHSHNLMIPTS